MQESRLGRILGHERVSSLEPSTAQIWVVVANTQMRSFGTSVEKSSILTAIEHGSVSLERMAGLFLNQR